ncbi:hypothetical protein LTS18_000597, partial [Coniosporium uncinatum]
MSYKRESVDIAGKHVNASPAYEPASLGEHVRGRQLSVDGHDLAVIEADQNKLHRDLKGRHMQMIAMQVQHLVIELCGGAIGAGLFVGSGGAFQTGGPAAVLIGFIIVGGMIYLMMQALAELAVMYPINGAFT